MESKGTSKKKGKRKNPSNLVKRGRIYHVRYYVDGAEKWQSTKKTSIKEATQIANTIINGIKSRDPDIVQVIERANRRKHISTFGDLQEAYEKHWRMQGIGSGPRQWNALMRVLRATVGDVDIGKLKLDMLTRDLVKDYQLKQVSAARGEKAQISARRTANSNMNKARAVFSGRAMEAYAGLVLPDLEGFLKCPAVLADTVQYVRRPTELVERTIRLGRELRNTDPDLYQCFLCSYDLALRANESANMRWEWLVKDRVGWLVQVAMTPDWKGPKGSQGSVSVSDEVAQQLLAWRQPGNPYVLPKSTHSARYKLVTCRFAGWMRSIGWDKEVYKTCAHELRKLMGSRWYTVQGPAVASANLRHGNVAVTCKYYAVLDHRPAPLTFEQANGCEASAHVMPPRPPLALVQHGNVDERRA